MNTTKIDEFISSEILSVKGFINIDENDIKNIRDNSDYIDALSVDTVDPSQIDVPLNKILDTLATEHSNDTIVSLLLLIKMNQCNSLKMSDLYGLNNFIATLHNVDVIWGIATDNKIMDGGCRIIALGGFNKQ